MTESIPTSFPSRSFRTIGSHILLIWGVSVLLTSPVSAQSASPLPAEEFPSLRIGVSGGFVFRESGMPGWTPGADARLSVDTPYAGGRLRIDGAYRAWTGSEDVQATIERDGSRGTVTTPDVRVVDILAGWGLSNAPDAPIFLEAGLLLGNRFMLFDLPAEAAGRLESEMLAGPWVRFGRITGPIRLFGEIRALRVLTNPRWDTIGISAGMAFEVSTPGWIRWVLR